MIGFHLEFNPLGFHANALKRGGTVTFPMYEGPRVEIKAPMRDFACPRPPLPKSVRAEGLRGFCDFGHFCGDKC